MTTDSYPARTEQNVLDSETSLIISSGKLTEGTAYTRKMGNEELKILALCRLNKIPTFHFSGGYYY